MSATSPNRFPLKRALLGGTLILGLATAAALASGPGDRFGPRGGPGGGVGPIGMLCGDRAGDRLDRIADRVDQALDLSEAQATAWAAVQTAVDGAIDDLAPTCAALAEGAEGDPSLPGRLAQMDLALTAMDDVLSAVTPAALSFYQTLDADQQALVDGLLDRGPGRDRAEGAAQGDRGRFAPGASGG